MPNTNQLVRKGRKRPKRTTTPGLKSGQGRKKRVAAPQRRGACARVATVTSLCVPGSASGRTQAHYGVEAS